MPSRAGSCGINSRRAPTTRGDPALIIGGSLLAAVLVALISVWISRTILRPVHRITSSADRISAGDLSMSAPSEGPVELARMSFAVNTALTAVAQARDEAIAATQRSRPSWPP